MNNNSEVYINILFEDNHLLVVEKPVNLLSQGDETGDIDLLTILKEDIRQRYNKPGEAFLGLVHRLDRPVGGVMVFARTSKAASRLSEQIRQKEFKKTYLAIVHGRLPYESGRLEHYLMKDGKTNTVSIVTESCKAAKKAELDYATIDSRAGLSLIRINLHTGRSHQIRVQFSAIGCPLFGDNKYGKECSRSGQQIALWSSRIICRHPTKMEDMTFSSVPPSTYPWDLFDLTNILNSNI